MENKFMKSLKIKFAATAAAAVLAAGPAAHASLTTVNDLWGNNGAGGEWNLYNTGVGGNAGSGVMEYLYGNFARVNDSSDLQWAGLNGSVAMKNVYAGAGQTLYTTATDGSSQSSLILSANGNGAVPSRQGSVAGFIPAAQPFLFLDQANGNNAYSDPSLSSGGVDRMVTFAVNGYLATPGVLGSYTAFNDGTHYVLGFEDGTDNDYNDLIVEVSGVAPVPEPSTYIAGALLLLPFGVGAVRTMRLRRN